MRNKMFCHTARDDSMFTIIRVISKHQDTQIYGAILPRHLTNQDMIESEAYKTYYAYATAEKTPKPKMFNYSSWGAGLAFPVGGLGLGGRRNVIPGRVRANRGSLNKKNHKITNKHSPTILYKMFQPANDEFSQHLSDDKESNHEDASDTGNLEWKLQEENFNWKGWYCLNTFTAEIQAVEKERKAKNILLMAIPKEHMRRFHGIDDAKEIWEAIRTRFGGNANSKKMQKAVSNNSLKHLQYPVQKG
ncbi:hypothetical protein Tco_1305211 [Tanacetum coccineum]